MGSVQRWAQLEIPLAGCQNWPAALATFCKSTAINYSRRSLELTPLNLKFRPWLAYKRILTRNINVHVVVCSSK